MPIISQKYKVINNIKETMLLYGLTLEDITPHLPRTKSKTEILKDLAGVWKNKKIDALDYQNKIRASLKTV